MDANLVISAPERGTNAAFATVRGSSEEIPEVAAARTAAPRLSEMTSEETETLFEEFMVKFEKSYEDEDEKRMRFQIFKMNLRRIDQVSQSVRLIHSAPTLRSMALRSQAAPHAIRCHWNASRASNSIEALVSRFPFSVYLFLCL